MRIIAGPCLHESRATSFEIATECKRVCDKFGVEYFFKASYDKANRSSFASPRGLGFDQTFLDFVWLKTQIPEIKILTDIHSVEDMQRHYVLCIDAVQIPALLSRQTDLIRAAVDTGLPINIKKGQFMAPDDIENILSKTDGAKEVWITERGTTFGYHNLVVDFEGMYNMLKHADIVFDASHSAQTPSAAGAASGGSKEAIGAMTRAASALGVQNFFIEVHPIPETALSDGATSLYLGDFEKIISDIVAYNYKRSS